MSIKIKVIKENKQKVDEGLEALLDPNVMASAAIALGVAIPFLKSLFSGGDRAALANMSADQIVDYVDISVHGSKKKAAAAKKKRESGQKRREKELERLKAARDAKKNKELPPPAQDDFMSLPLKGDEVQTSSPTLPSGEQPTEGDIRRYAKASNIAKDPGALEAENARRMMAKLEKEFPNIKELAKNIVLQEAKEMFRRFMV